MNIYDEVAQQTSRDLTKNYSTSFSKASLLFPHEIRSDIYNIYGMVRVADELVDSYDGSDTLTMLNEFEQDVYSAIKRGYSANLICHAFALTAGKYNIGLDIIQPFFVSMRIDALNSYNPSKYSEYIYGSAEVVGLMCLKVFTKGDDEQYARLAPGAQALGSAFQKVNFLRDLADDQLRLGRYYFPVGSFETFNDVVKREVINDIRSDFETAESAISVLPVAARSAVQSAEKYYKELLSKLDKTGADTLLSQRIRISDRRKLIILVSTITLNRISSLSSMRKKK